MMLQINQQFGRYKIISVLGIGGMGEVYLAEDSQLKRKVALKILTLKAANIADYQRRFKREAQAISALNNLNIVVIYEIGELDETHFIAMEFVEGENLRYLLNEERMSLRDAVDIAVQTSSALAAAHLSGITHRDIKPENIIRRPDGIVKVLDFGLAKQKLDASESEIDPEAPTQAHQLTTPGMIMGTAAYMSPEQARGQETDERTDIWSVGVVLYEMIAGCVPFPGETKSDMMAAILKTDAPPLALYVPDAPPELEAIVKKALDKNIAERYANISDLMNDLKDYQSGMTTSIHPVKMNTAITGFLKKADTTNVTFSSQIFQRKVSWFWAAIPAVILLLGFSGWYFTQKPKLPEINPASLASAQVVSWKSDLGEDSSNRARFSPDGKLIAYVAVKNGKNSIWLKQLGGGEPFTRKQDDAEDASPVWSPDSNNIAYLSTHGGQRGIWMFPAFGGTPNLLSPVNGKAQLVSWSKDGTVYFEMKQNLYALIISSKQITKLTDFDETKPANHDFSVSPDERQIVYSDRKDGQRDLWTADLHGKNPVRLTNDEFDDFQPVWHPDGQRIIYNSTRNSVQQICLVYLDGRPNVQFTFNDNDSVIADISADGTKILYQSAKDDSDLWGVNLNDKTEFQITSDIGTEFWQDVAPNGEDLVYQSASWTSVGNKQYDSSIVSQKIKNTGQKNTLFSNGFTPRYSPDAKQIAFLHLEGTKTNLWVTSPSGGDSRQLTTEGVFYGGYTSLPFNHLQTQDVCWSPDSLSLIYAADREGISNIWQSPIDGSGEKNLTNNKDKNLRFLNPLFTSNGNRFVFTGIFTDDKNKRYWNIWLSENGNITKIYQTDSVLQIVGWSAAENEVIVKSIEKGNEFQILPTNVNLLEFSANGGEPRLISTLKEVYFHNIKLSPDHKTIAFAARQVDNDAIQLLPSTGGTAKTLISGNDARVFFSNLTFAPDGKTIYYGKQANWRVISMIENFK